jgi:hypothetical protein
MIAPEREPNVDGLQVVLVFELEPPVTARLAVDLPDGRPLVTLDLTGEETVRLLAGEQLSEPGTRTPRRTSRRPRTALGPVNPPPRRTGSGDEGQPLSP